MDPAKKTERYHHGNLKSALLQASVDILKEKGMESLTLREAARRAGVSQAAPYRHFESKESLIAELIGQGMGDICQRMQPDSEGEMPSATERFLKAGQAYLDFAFEHPHFFTLLMTRDLKMYHSDSEGLAGTEIQKNICSCRELVEELKEEGYFARLSCEDALVEFWSLCYGFASVYISGRNTLLEVDENRLQLLLQNSLKGMLLSSNTEM